MFRTWPLSKRFAVLSGPLVIGAGLLIATMIHIWFVESVERAAERNNVALARVLSNVVWPDFETDVLERQAASDWRTNLTREVASLLRHTTVVKIKLYRSNGEVAYSTDPNKSEEDEGSEGFDAAIKGEVKSEI